MQFEPGFNSLIFPNFQLSHGPDPWPLARLWPWLEHLLHGLLLGEISELASPYGLKICTKGQI